VEGNCELGLEPGSGLCQYKIVYVYMNEVIASIPPRPAEAVED
jgi:hypothetical protein